jgi:hypothetical protein
MIGMPQAEVERGGKTTTARRYHFSSAKLAAGSAAPSKATGGIENQLHWVMDVVLHDDLMRLRTSMALPTWRSSGTPPSISSAPSSTTQTSKSVEKSSPGTNTTF